MTEHHPLQHGDEKRDLGIDGRGLSHEDRLTAIEERLRRGASRIKAIEEDVAENTVITREVRDLLQLGRNGLRVLGWLGACARWATAVGVPAAAIWHFLNGQGSGAPK